MAAEQEPNVFGRIVAILALGVVAFYLVSVFYADPAPEPLPAPEPVRPAPAPCPGPGPCPAPRPWGPREEIASVEAKVGGRVSPDGVPLQLDLPGDRHKKNKGGSDGKGLCVFTSIGHSADWHGIEALVDFRDWMTRRPGGGWPDKVDQMIAARCKEAGVPIPDYVQYEGADLGVLDRMCSAGLMPGVTYYRSPTGRYGGSKIYHMTTCLHADGKRYAILDNNYPGDNAVEWMDASEAKRALFDGGRYWAFAFLRQGPPPVPRNQ